MGAKKPQGLSGFLAQGTRFDGDLFFTENLRLEGEFRGRIHSPEATLVLAPAARVEAEVEVAELYVAGSVEGTIIAHRRLEVAATGTIAGEVYSPNLIVRDGAVVDGICHMEVPAERVEARRNARESKEERKSDPSRAQTQGRGTSKGETKDKKPDSAGSEDSGGESQAPPAVWRRSGWQGSEETASSPQERKAASENRPAESAKKA